jgi:hypothetical protein
VPHHGQLAGIRTAETGQAGNQRRLAGTVRSQQTEELALGDLQRNAGERLHAAKALFDAIDGNGDAHGIVAGEAAPSGERQEFGNAVERSPG